MRRVIQSIIVMCTTLLLFYVGCSQKEQQTEEVPGTEPVTAKVTPTSRPVEKPPSKPTYGGELRFNLTVEPISLNPILLSDISSYFVTYLLFESLIDVDKNLNFVPRLAESWQISPDSKKISFTMRKGVTWHDGKPVTAKDLTMSAPRSGQEQALRLHRRDHRQPRIEC